jgi:hypothetical protein
LRNTSITSRKTKPLPANFSFTVQMKIETKFNLRGYTIADGILAKIVSAKGLVKRVVIAGKKEISYLVSDGNGNHAHGKTLAEAKQDLFYKADAQFDGEIPKSATGKEWVGIYRAVTGACAAGVKGFVEASGRSLDDTYTSQQIAELVRGKFGEEKFLQQIAKS